MSKFKNFVHQRFYPFLISDIRLKAANPPGKIPSAGRFQSRVLRSGAEQYEAGGKQSVPGGAQFRRQSDARFYARNDTFGGGDVRHIQGAQRPQESENQNCNPGVAVGLCRAMGARRGATVSAEAIETIQDETTAAALSQSR